MKFGIMLALALGLAMLSIMGCASKPEQARHAASWEYLVNFQ